MLLLLLNQFRSLQDFAYDCYFRLVFENWYGGMGGNTSHLNVVSLQCGLCNASDIALAPSMPVWFFHRLQDAKTSIRSLQHVCEC